MLTYNKMHDELEEHKLLQDKMDTILDLYIKEPDKDVADTIKKALKELRLITSPSQVMLDICYSHPVMDTNNFNTPKKCR
jgi:hypothetical protein